MSNYTWIWDKDIKGPYILLMHPNKKTTRKRVYIPGFYIYINKEKYYLNLKKYIIEEEYLWIKNKYQPSKKLIE